MKQTLLWWRVVEPIVRILVVVAHVVVILKQIISTILNHLILEDGLEISASFGYRGEGQLPEGQDVDDACETLRMEVNCDQRDGPISAKIVALEIEIQCVGRGDGRKKRPEFCLGGDEGLCGYTHVWLSLNIAALGDCGS